MLKRLFALLVLVLIGVAVYAWSKERGGRADARLQGTAEELRRDARTFSTEAKEKLGEVGKEIGEVGQDIGDAKLAVSVKTAIRFNRNLRPYRIEASADHGAVTLRGQIGSEELRARAGEVAGAVPDVKQVVNQLQVVPGVAALPAADRTMGEQLDDHALEMKVKIALSLNKALKGTDLTVTAYRRQVTLGGAVASATQRDLALQTARETAPPDSVVDQITVRGVADRALPDKEARGFRVDAWPMAG